MTQNSDKPVSLAVRGKHVETVTCQCKPYKRYVCPTHRPTSAAPVEIDAMIHGSMGKDFERRYEPAPVENAELVTDQRELPFREGFRDGWRYNQTRRLSGPAAEDEAWKFYRSPKGENRASLYPIDLDALLREARREALEEAAHQVEAIRDLQGVELIEDRTRRSMLTSVAAAIRTLSEGTEHDGE